MSDQKTAPLARRLGRAWVPFFVAGWLIANTNAIAQEGPSPPPGPDKGVQGQAEEGDLHALVRTAAQQQAATEISAALGRIEDAIRDLVTEETDRRIQDAEQREIDNLRAQMQMAFWALWMFVATAVAVLLTAFGVFLLWRTLKYTRNAASTTKLMLIEAEKTTEAAIRAAESAEQQVNASRQALIADQRAWIEITEMRPLSGIEKRNGGGFGISIMLTATNIGKTPAHLTRIIIVTEPVIAPIDSNKDNIESWKRMCPDDEQIKSIIFPGRQAIRKISFGFDPHRIRQILQKNNSDGFRYISVACCVFYRTIFGEHVHRTIDQIHIYHEIENLDMQGRPLNLNSDGVALAELSQLPGAGFAASYAD